MYVILYTKYVFPEAWEDCDTISEFPYVLTKKTKGHSLDILTKPLIYAMVKTPWPVMGLFTKKPLHLSKNFTEGPVTADPKRLFTMSHLGCPQIPR